VLDRQPDQLDFELSEVYRFTRAVVERTGEEAEVRESLRARYGEDGLVEFALAIASCRVFPITKRALGYTARCEQVQIV
jgi:hypothetical protein